MALCEANPAQSCQVGMGAAPGSAVAAPLPLRRMQTVSILNTASSEGISAPGLEVLRESPITTRVRMTEQGLPEHLTVLLQSRYTCLYY